MNGEKPACIQNQVLSKMNNNNNLVQEHLHSGPYPGKTLNPNVCSNSKEEKILVAL